MSMTLACEVGRERLSNPPLAGGPRPGEVRQSAQVPERGSGLGPVSPGRTQCLLLPGGPCCRGRAWLLGCRGLGGHRRCQEPPLGDAGPGAGPQSRGCQPGSGSVPRAQWFPLTDVPTAPREGGQGTREGRCLAPLGPKPQWPGGRRLLGRDGPAGQPGAWPADPPRRPPAVQRLADGADPRLPWPRKAEAALCIILGRGADLEERIRRKQEEEQACRGARRPLAARGNFGFWGHVPRRPALPPPLPTHLRRCWPIARAGNKVAVSPQGSQAGGVTPDRHRPELGHPACGHSLRGGRCSVSTSFLPASTHLP